MSSYSFLAEALTEKYGIEESRIQPDATLTDLGLDSLSVVEFVFDLEEEFGIEVSEEDADFKTLGEAAALVDRLVAAKSD